MGFPLFSHPCATPRRFGCFLWIGRFGMPLKRENKEKKKTLKESKGRPWENEPYVCLLRCLAFLRVGNSARTLCPFLSYWLRSFFPSLFLVRKKARRRTQIAGDGKQIPGWETKSGLRAVWRDQSAGNLHLLWKRLQFFLVFLYTQFSLLVILLLLILQTYCNPTGVLVDMHGKTYWTSVICLLI